MPTQTPLSLTALEKTLQGARSILFRQTRLIDLALNHLSTYQNGNSPYPVGTNEKVLDVILQMTHVVGISGHAILRLTESIALYARDAFSIARSILETAINVAFIAAEGETAAIAAKKHAEQKAYRDLYRESKIGNFKIAVGWTGKVSPSEELRLRSIVSEFSTKSGGEKRDWIDKNLEQRLELIEKRFGSKILILLHSALLMIYRHASEILHGTYFGSLFLWGATAPGKRPSNGDELRLILGHHQLTVLSATIMIYAALLECIGQYIHAPDLTALSEELIREFENLPEIRDALKDGN